MEMKNFIECFASQFEETEKDLFSNDTKFRELDEWSSLSALTIIAMCDEEYNVQIKGDDLKNSHTIEDLFHIVQARIKQ